MSAWKGMERKAEEKLLKIKLVRSEEEFLFWVLIESVCKLLNPGKPVPNSHATSACKEQLFKVQTAS